MVRGAASDLLLWMLNRVSYDNVRIEASGTRALLDRWALEMRF
jgi:hypothetical protein